MRNTKIYKIFIGAFLFLYLIVAFISFMHSIEFFNVGNEHWMSVLLGCAYELGQAVVLASILLSENKKSLLTWFLFIVLTCVQVIGNVFSVYKYISISGQEYYKYLQEPLLFWIQGVNEQSIKVIISWITGALLPLVALGMTGMVSSNIQILNNKKEKPNNLDDNKKEIINDSIIDIPNNKKEEQSKIIQNVVEEPKHIEVGEDTKKELENILNSSTNIQEESKKIKELDFSNKPSPLSLNFKQKEES